MSLPKFTPEERVAIEKVLAETPFVTEGEPFDLAAALFVAGRNFAASAPQAVVVPSTDAFKEAYMEWSRKTDWVLEQQDSFPFRTLGIHRADIMRQEIERLRAALASSPVAQQWRRLSDAEWTNIVDYDNAYEGYVKGDAVYEAVKRTEAKLRELNAAPVAQQQGWISIKDRLPPENQMVALVDEETWVNTGHKDLDLNLYAAGYLTIYGELDCHKSWSVYHAPRGLILEAFTHWMPLPAAPSTASPSNMEKGNG